MCYIRKSGYGNYGPRNKQKGGRLLILTETNDNGVSDFTYTNEIINEDGSIEPNEYRWQGYKRFQLRCRSFLIL